MEERKLGRDIHIVSNKIRRKMDAATQQFDITHTQFHILLFISKRENAVYQKDIENAFNLRRSTVSKILALLEKKELIKKEAVKEDARLKKISITENGTKQLALVKGTLKDIDNYFIGSINTEDMSIFYKVLNKLSELAD